MDLEIWLFVLFWGFLTISYPNESDICFYINLGGNVIDIWEKSNFFGSIGSQKGAKNAFFRSGGALKAPLMVGFINVVEAVSREGTFSRS